MFEASNSPEINEVVRIFAEQCVVFAEEITQASQMVPSGIKYIFSLRERAFNLAHEHFYNHISTWGQGKNLPQDDWFSYFTQADIDFLMQATLAAIRILNQIVEDSDAKQKAMSALLNKSFLGCLNFYASQTEPDIFRLTKAVSEIAEVIFKYADKKFSELFPALTNTLILINLFLRSIVYDSEYSPWVEIQRYAHQFKICTVEKFPSEMEDNHLYFAVIDENFYCQHKYLDKPVRVFYQEIGSLLGCRRIYVLMDDEVQARNITCKVDELKSDSGGMQVISSEFVLNLQLNCIQTYSEIQAANVLKAEFTKCMTKEKLTNAEKKLLNKLTKFCLEMRAGNRLQIYYKITSDFLTRSNLMMDYAGTLRATIFLSPKFETAIQNIEIRCSQIFTEKLNDTKTTNLSFDERMARLEKALQITEASYSILMRQDILPLQKFTYRLSQLISKLNELETQVIREPVHSQLSS